MDGHISFPSPGTAFPSPGTAFPSPAKNVFFRKNFSEKKNFFFVFFDATHFAARSSPLLKRTLLGSPFVPAYAFRRRPPPLWAGIFFCRTPFGIYNIYSKRGEGNLGKARRRWSNVRRGVAIFFSIVGGAGVPFTIYIIRSMRDPNFSAGQYPRQLALVE